MTAPRELNVTDLLDGGRLGRFQLGAFGVLAACLVMDGFDVQAMAYVAPTVIREWGLPTARMAPAFGAGLLGLFVGSLAFGMLADRIGRRPVLLASTACFGVFTLLTAHAGALGELVVLRLLAGLGLGGIMPNATALVGEYSPRARRVAAMMIVTNGFMVGAVLGGFLSAWLIPTHGWRAVFRVGGIVPLLLLLPMWVWLPESLQFLALRDRGADVGRWLRRVDPSAPAGPDVRYGVREERRAGVPLLHLFHEGRSTATSLLWVVNFANVLNAYFVSSWLPTVLRDAGRSTSAAVLVATAVQAGGAIGTVVLGLVLQRAGFVPVLTACFGGAAICLVALGSPGLPLGLLAGVAFLAGWGIFGGQPGVNALAATIYPTDLRSTGIGAGLAVGRFGAVLGPLVAGELLRRQGSSEALFQLAAVPALVSAAGVLAMRRTLRRCGAEGATTVRRIVGSRGPSDPTYGAR
jgi:AAHS family 4-hydroxybenzoate transporter-like MFS transporter